MQRHLIALLTVICLQATQATFGDQWPNWRGPSNNGICNEKNVPLEWNTTKNIAWKLPMPGPGRVEPRRLG